MKAENKWEEAVREKLTGMEKNLPEGDWSEFLARSEAGKKSTAKVSAIILGCCMAAAAIAAVFMLPKHSTEPEHINPALPKSLLSENTTHTSEPQESIDNEISIIPPKRYSKRAIPESTVDTPQTSETEAPDEDIDAPDEENTVSDIGRQDESDTTPEGPRSSHSSESNDPFIQENDNERTSGHGVNISILGTGGRSSSINTTFGGTNNDMNEASDSYEYTHRRPVTFGMTASYGLTPRLSIVSGLEYSRFRSNIDYLKENISVKQRADYLGIPLKIDYLFLKTGGLSTYASAGVKADWCVNASCAGERLRDKGLNWTASAAIGAQYRILNGISVYFEPEVSHYLNKGGAALETYRTQNPTMFSIVLGLRLSIGGER